MLFVAKPAAYVPPGNVQILMTDVETPNRLPVSAEIAAFITGQGCTAEYVPGNGTQAVTPNSAGEGVYVAAVVDALPGKPDYAKGFASGTAYGDAPTMAFSPSDIESDIADLLAAWNAKVSINALGEILPYDTTGSIQIYTCPTGWTGEGFGCAVEPVTTVLTLDYLATLSGTKQEEFSSGKLRVIVGEWNGSGDCTIYDIDVASGSITETPANLGNDEDLRATLDSLYGGDLPLLAVGIMLPEWYLNTLYSITRVSDFLTPRDGAFSADFFQPIDAFVQTPIALPYAVFGGTPPEPPASRNMVAFEFPISGEETEFRNWSFPAWRMRIPFQNYSFSVANTRLIKGRK